MRLSYLYSSWPVAQKKPGPFSPGSLCLMLYCFTERILVRPYYEYNSKDADYDHYDAPFRPAVSRRPTRKLVLMLELHQSIYVAIQAHYLFR